MSRLSSASMTLFDEPNLRPTSEGQVTSTVSSSPTPVTRHHRDENELCRVCGEWGAFGFDVARLKGKHGRFACSTHRAQVEGMSS